MVKIGNISAWCKELTTAHSRCTVSRLFGSAAEQATEVRKPCYKVHQSGPPNWVRERRTRLLSFEVEEGGQLLGNDIRNTMVWRSSRFRGHRREID
jgi:hypothetical protein